MSGNAEIRELVARLERLCGQVPVAVSAIDTEYRLIFSNAACDQLVGYDGKAFLGERGPFPWSMDESLEPPVDREPPPIVRKMRALAGARAPVVRTAIRHKSGEVVPILRTGTGVRSNGRRLAWIGFLLQVSVSIAPPPRAVQADSLEAELFDYLTELSRARQRDFQRFTPRETEVLDQLRNGLAPKKVAQVLDISENTVRNHVRTIYKKLGVSSARELLVKLRAG